MGNKNSSNPTPNGEEAKAGDPMNPIVFENAINTAYENLQNSPKNGSRFTTLSKYTGSTQQKSAIKQDVQLNLNNLSVIMENQELYRSKLQTSVPFSVVQLSIEPAMATCINQLDPHFFQKYKKQPGQESSKWKINSKGFYYKALSDNRIVILKPGFLYEGQYISGQGDIIPDNKGKLFSTRGMYHGSFKSGQAHGQGAYYDNILHSTNKGLWVNGQLRKGEVDNQYYTYTGQFVQGIANGEGQLTYKQQKAFYKGHFKEGIYQDQTGYFQSDYYDYSGGFKEGKKEGIGCLIQKQRYLKGKNKKYRPQQQFEGYFENDYYKGKKKAGGE